MASQPETVRLTVLAHMPADFTHCAPCEQLLGEAGVGEVVHREIRASFPLDVLEDAARLATWMQELSVRFGERLRIRVVDPQSVGGFWLSLRHWIRRYPAFILNGRVKYSGWEPAVLESLLTQQMALPPVPWRTSVASSWRSVLGHLCRAARAVRQMLYGATTFGWAQGLRRERAEVERLFVLVTFGDIVGLPILPPYYTLRLLPYTVMALHQWRRSLLRERDWTDLTELIEGVD